jgi:hypothetical protein
MKKPRFFKLGLVGAFTTSGLTFLGIGYVCIQYEGYRLSFHGYSFKSRSTD